MQNNENNENNENTEHSEFDMSQIPIPKIEGHVWRQMGFQLICQSCQQAHAALLPPGIQYQGNDENGKPMLKKIW